MATPVQPYSLYREMILPEDYEFTLSGEQTAFLHNMLIEEVEAKLLHVFDETKPVQSAQKQAYITARIELLTELLNRSN